MAIQPFPFVRFIAPPDRGEPDALMGFCLPFLPDMLTSRWLSGSEQERLEQALRLQQRLISAFWDSGVAAWDLRFVGTDDIPGVAVGLLCRLRRPPQIPPAHFRDYCLQRALYVQQLFADFGYELLALANGAELARYLTPFSFQALAEVRRHEELLVMQNTYNEYEVYVTYPWQWAPQTRLRLFEALLHRQSNCLVSIYLEPTQLNQQEQSHLNHATSMQVKDLLRRSGPKGQTAYNIYQDYARNLRQPYLVRISLASSTPQTAQQIGRMFQDELHAPQLLRAAEQVIVERYSAPSTSGTGPTLTFPQNAQEWQWACRSLFNVEWHPWGHHYGMELPGTARLRYLTDDIGASMPFRLPIARSADIPGVPVRSLPPSTGAPPMPGTTGPTVNRAPTIAGMDPQSSIAAQRTLQITPTILPAASAIRRPEDLIGQTLGGCQIEELIGQGGFGAVYRAVQTGEICAKLT